MNRLVRNLTVAALMTFPAATVAQRATAPEAPKPVGPLPETAQVFSTIGAVAPLGMMAFGVASQSGDLFAEGLLLLIPGPSIGYFYGRRPWRGLISSGVRLAGAAGIVGSALICWNGCSGSDFVLAAVTGWGGFGLMVAASVYDVVRVGPDVRGANNRRVARIAPTVDLTTGRMRLGLAVRF